jgi:VWFA-related protein
MTFRAAAFPCAAVLFSLAAASRPGEVRIVSGPYRRPATLSVEASLVDLAVTVRDGKGRAVGGLRQPDFQIFDNAEPRPIAFFSEERAASAEQTATSAGAAATVQAVAAPPRSIALFFDDAHSGPGGFERSRRAAQKLISEGLRPGDRAAIFTSSGSVALDLTDDRQALLDALARLRRHTDPGVRGTRACPVLTAYQAYVIAKHQDEAAKRVAAMDVLTCAPDTPWQEALNIAQAAADTSWEMLRPESSTALEVLRIVVRDLAHAPGTRILLMVSPGFVTAGLDRQSSDITAACLRDHITVNALDDEGLASFGPELAESLGLPSGPRAGWAAKTLMLRNQIVQSFMADTAAATGGTFLHNTNDLFGGLRTLTAPPECSYRIAFAAAGKPDGKYHRVKVKTRQTGVQIAARPGYFSERVETAQQHIDRVVSSGEALTGFPALVEAAAAPERDGRYRIQVRVELDARRLPFEVRDGASLQQLTFVTVLEDAQGNFLEGKQSEMNLELSRATRADMEAHGLYATATFLAPKGSYRVREVVREAVHNRIAASNTPVDAR